MRVLMLPAVAAILLIGADLLCAPAANAQVQSPSPGATAQPSNIPDQKLDAAAAAVEPCSGACREAIELYFSTLPERWRAPLTR